MPSLITQQQTNQKAPKAIIRRLLADPGTFATTLLMIVLHQYEKGRDPEKPEDNPLSWHPKTLRLELAQDFGVDIPAINGDKLNAAIMLLTSDRFFNSPEAFVKLCNVLSGSPMSHGVFDPADAAECAWGIIEGMIISPFDDDEKEPFSEEIRGYIGKVLDVEGIKSPPDVLRIGLRDRPADFSGFDLTDPGVFQNEFAFQNDRSREIEIDLMPRLKELFEEVRSLPFEIEGTDDVLEQLNQRIAQTQAGLQDDEALGLN